MNEALEKKTSALLEHAGISAAIREIRSFSGGGNNRLYRVETEAGAFALKEYFRDSRDSRDRLASEYAFLSYAATAAPGFTPRPYAADLDAGLALYEFVEGRVFAPDDVGAAEVDAAIKFFRALNSPARRREAKLPLASEAVFSLSEHLTLVGSRIERLRKMAPHSEVDAEAAEFLSRLERFWREIAAEIPTDAKLAGIDPDSPLADEDRCISPSDFGFHNALKAPGGAIRFLDFEYAGWDDPAKTAGDFFAQIAVPVPFEYHDRFVAECMAIFPHSALLAARAKILRPVYQVKWCCIALNVFLQVNLARRKFADAAIDETTLKRQQLAKAEKIFQSIQTTTYGLH